MSKIEWTEKTWNPVVGCSHASPGCDHCYAERMARRQVHMGTAHYAGTVGDSGWTGQTAIAPDSIFFKPLHWKKPRRIFVCSMGDLFHESVDFDTIDRVFAVMALCPQHTFQCLTKRAERMKEYVCWRSVEPDMANRYDRGQKIDGSGYIENHICGFTGCRWPLPNVWLGVTAENQGMADKRIPILLDTPAAVRFVSCEPMLGAIDLDRSIGGTLWIGGQRGCAGTHRHRDCPHPHHHHDNRCKPGLDWVIAGGESGPGARPMRPDWIRDLRDQCKAAGVPFLFKQWGDSIASGAVAAEYRVKEKKGGRMLDGVLHDAYPEVKL